MYAPNPMELEQKVLGRRMFGENLPTNKYRNFYEPSNPTTQCNNIIGEFINGTPCYICGLPIVRQKDDGDGLGPECEHILPIAQAILFLGLYGAKYKPEQVLYNPKILNLEYAWAHRTCNQVKSDNVYTMYNPYNEQGKRFAVNIDGLRILLNDIWNNDRSNSILFNNTLKQTFKSEEEFINSRFIQPVNKNGTPIENFPPKKGQVVPSILLPFQKIVDYLNSFDSSEMLLLIGAAKAMEGPMSREAAFIIRDINHNKIVENKIASLKKNSEDYYDAILAKTITKFTKEWKDPTLIENFKQKALSYKPFYTSLYVKLPNTLHSGWTDYIGINFYIMLYDLLVNEPIVIDTLLKIASGSQISSNVNENNIKISQLAQLIDQYISKDFYKDILFEQEHILHNNNNNNNSFESAAASISPLALMGIDRPTQGKLGLASGVKLAKKPKPIYVRPNLPKPEKPVRKSLKAKAANNMAKKGQERRAEKAIAIRKEARNRETAKRRQLISVGKLEGLPAEEAIQQYQGTSNNNNMLGGKRYRKTRKVKK